jgi:hypothetical protein
MTGGINPEAAQPSSTQAFEQSDRNPVVAELGGPEANGGQWPAPSAADSRVTQPGAAISPDAGLTNYDIGDSVDDVEDEAERQG